MKISKLTMTGAMALALAACSSSDSADPDTIVSSGILEIDLPADSSGYGEGVAALIDQVTTANETGSVITPTGNASFVGTWGAEVNDYVGGDGALIGGEATIDVNFDSSSAAIDFAVDFAEEASEGEIPVFGSITEDEDGLTIAAGLLSGTLEGNFIVGTEEDSETYIFDGTLDGAFADVDGTNTAFGQFDGTLTNTTEGSPDEGLTDEVGGLYNATEVLP